MSSTATSARLQSVTVAIVFSLSSYKLLSDIVALLDFNVVFRKYQLFIWAFTLGVLLKLSAVFPHQL